MQSSAAAERNGRFLFSPITSLSIVTETTTATAYVTAATSTNIVVCTDSQYEFTNVCNDTMGMQDPWFLFSVASTTTTTAASTTSGGVGKRRRRSADGEGWEEEWDYEGEEEDGEDESEDDF